MRICGGAYGLAAIACFMDLGGILGKLHINERVAYVFESGSEGAPQVNRVFQANIKDPLQRDNLHLLSLNFKDKRDFLPLQAADILAYELYQESPRIPEKKNARHPLKVLGKMPRSWGRIDAEGLRQWEQILSTRVRFEDAGELPPL